MACLRIVALVIVAVVMGLLPMAAAGRQLRAPVNVTAPGTDVTVVDDTGEVVVDAPFTGVRAGPSGGSVGVPGIDVAWGGTSHTEDTPDGGGRRLAEVPGEQT